MEIARAEAQAGGDLFSVAHAQAQTLERSIVLAVSLHVGKQREIVVGFNAVQVKLQAIGQRAGFRAAFSDGGVGENGHAVVYKIRALAGGRIAAFDAIGQGARLLLRRFDIRLVEGVDAEYRAGDGNRHFPDEEQLRNLVTVRDSEFHYRMAAALERGKRRVRRVLFAQTQMYEHAILAVGLTIAERFPVDGYQAFPLLARGLRNQLFEPGADAGDFGSSNNRDLVTVEFAREHAERDPEPYARIGGGRHHVGATCAHQFRTLQKTRDIHACEGRRNKAKLRKHRETAADGGIARKGFPELIACRFLFERTAGIGNRDEMRAGLSIDFAFARHIQEVVAQDVGFERAARLGTDNEDRAGG